MIVFADRKDAGARLAKVLARLPYRDPLVLALPRGGVPVAAPIAEKLAAPLDVWVVRKLGAPGSPEVGIGAIAEGGEIFVDARLAAATGATEDDIEAELMAKRAEVAQGMQRYRQGRGRPRVEGRSVIVVDDGIANGVTARCAVRDIKKLGASRVVLAVPVGATDAVLRLERECDGVICLGPLSILGSVGAHYLDFEQTSDEEVVALLRPEAAEGDARR